MDFSDKLNQFIALIPSLLERCKTEEATKHSLVMPFINLLGYNVFNPLEVVPEFCADLGIKKGEKIDYALIINSEPCIFIECKHHLEQLDVHHSQLFRYFAVTPVKFAILTNGVKYQFFTDLEEVNKMDLKPFFEVDLLNLRNNQIEELKKFQKEIFDPEIISSNANQLKYTTNFKSLLQEEIINPSDDFAKHFVKNLYSGRITQNILDSFKEIIKNGFAQYLSEVVQNKLKTALKSNENIETEEIVDKVEIQEENKVITSPEELQGFYIVRSIIGEIVDIERIFWRDNQNYFTILVDDKNYKWFCRLYFNREQKYVIIPDENKKEQKFLIDNLGDIYKLKLQIVDALQRLI